MRKQLAFVLAILFAVLFLVAITLNQIADTISDPEVMIDMVNDAEMYDYIYVNLIENAVYDLVDRGIEIDFGKTQSSNVNVFRFDDPDAATGTITRFIGQVLPREFVQRKFEESLTNGLLYVRADVDDLTIDLEVQDRILEIPDAARDAVPDLKLAEEITADVIIPQLTVLSAEIFNQALGIEFTPQEVADIAHLILAPEWLDAQLLGAIEATTPYFAGDADDFKFVLKFDDRVELAGQILKNKLKAEDTLYKLVFAQVIGPLIQQTIAQSTAVGFGVFITEEEVRTAFEVIAPREWVRMHGDGIIDALVIYMVGSTEVLSYTVDLTDRKAAAATEIQRFARDKLKSILGGISACTSDTEAINAAQDLEETRLPRCIGGGQETVDRALDFLLPVLNSQIEAFVNSQIPPQLTYSQHEFEAQAGGGIDVLKSVRQRVIEGIDFTEQDLLDAMSSKNDPASRRNAEDVLRFLADGVLITEKNITKSLDSSVQKQLDDYRGYVQAGLSLRWMIWAALLIPLFAIAYLGGRGWSGRMKWAGGVMACSALIIYMGIAIAWSLVLSDQVMDKLPAFDAVGTEIKDTFPRLGAELESNAPRERIKAAVDSWVVGWRDQAIPWIIAGVVAFAVGTGWPSADSKSGAVKSTGSKAAAPQN